MLQALTEWAAGRWAGNTARAVAESAFFLLFAATSLLLLLPGRDTLRRGAALRPHALLSLLVAIAFAALFVCQMRWQLLGSRNADLMRFMSRHNTRAAALVRRGAILDRNGSPLALNDEGASGRSRRRYPLGAKAAHVVGYFDPRFGLAGVEKAADATLSGFDAGEATRGGLGQLGRSLVVGQPATGGDVRLSLDARLQEAAADAMGGRRGAVVALDPATGEILALFSAPGFDPGKLDGFHGDDEAAPFLNRAIQGRYPAGSTFKVFMALMAADTETAPVLDCPAGGFRAVGGEPPIRDSEYYAMRRDGKVWRGFGMIGLKDALVHSSNVYFAQLGLRIPAATFNAYVGRLGVNGPVTLLDVAGGALVAPAGSVPRIEGADRGARAQLAIGQGRMAVSPLDVAMWTAAVANGGVLQSPRLEPDAPAGKYPSARLASRGAAETVGAMMRLAVTEGTGRGGGLPPELGVCGKTGTAQNPRGDDHSWFTCFCADASPRLVVTVLVENGGFGARNALPVAARILREVERQGIVRPRGGSRERGAK